MGLLPDIEFHLQFTVRFGLSTDSASFIDPWIRSLHVELLTGTVTIDPPSLEAGILQVLGFFSLDDFIPLIEAGFKEHADVGSFPVTTSTPAHPLSHDQAKLVILDMCTTTDGGIEFLVSPEPPIQGFNGSWAPLVQREIDDFVADF
jgi:hypothetical protein